ncbi:SDR family NAD(P)-dependent oxidoreductase [Pseudonocardia acaciae]|uniref:SDR family NAD(P)-dependent oxidoreductase n=1 Tax=Pseudonocardia acaciae TaxID=551276 RepID=UPI00048CFD56|nr:SDR family NAD(P)-dependent oxidoreductase [Pseudonocardia acaciae]
MSLAVVTGGAGSIGAVIARRLADAGHRVCVADLDPDRARAVAAELPGEHVSFGGDLSDEPTVIELARTVDALAPVTVLVNAAGISPKGPAGKLEIDEIDASGLMAVLRANTVGPFLVSTHLARQMPTDGTASIVNILSIATRMATGGRRDAVFPPFIPSASHYAASKAALHNLQVSMCRELAPRRIRVNGVAPGFIATAMNRNIADGERASVVRQIPLGRAGTPEDVADAVEFLAGPRASYITGAVLDVNGGWLPA